MKERYFKFLVVIILLVVAVFLDQWSKIWAEDNLSIPRFPEHTVTKTVNAETPTITLQDYIKAAYPNNNEDDVKSMMAYVRKEGQRVLPQDTLNQGDQIELGFAKITVIEGYYDYQYARNPGAAFSFLADQSPDFRKYFFGISGILAVILILVFIGMSDWRKQKPLILSLGCILGGAIGNIIDRFQYGYVIDFVSWHYQDVYYWPTFNIADVFVTGGVIFLILDMIIHRNSDNKEAIEADAKAEDADAKAEDADAKAEEADAKAEISAEEPAKADDTAEAPATPEDTVNEDAKTEDASEAASEVKSES